MNYLSSDPFWMITIHYPDYRNLYKLSQLNKYYYQMANPKDRILYRLNKEMKKFFGPRYQDIQQILYNSNILITGNIISHILQNININMVYFFSSYTYFIINEDKMDQFLNIYPDLPNDDYSHCGSYNIFEKISSNHKTNFGIHHEKFKENSQYKNQESCVINDNGIFLIDYQKLFQKIEFPNI